MSSRSKLHRAKVANGSALTKGLSGAGGMGEVFRPGDTQLKRGVAMKVLPEALASDPVRMGRLSVRPKLLASPNHPNIFHQRNPGATPM